MKKIIDSIIHKRDINAVMTARKNQLRDYVALYGVELTAAATGLKESTLNQYLRESNPRIGLEPLEQAAYVFSDQRFIDAIK